MDSFISEWEHASLRCRTGGWLCPCGYVQVPELLLGCLRPESLDVHGGSIDGPDRDGWIGFDTGHPGDVWDDFSWMPPHMREHMEIDRELQQKVRSVRWTRLRTMEPVRMADDSIHWTLNRLVAETERLAEQIAAMVRTP